MKITRVKINNYRNLRNVDVSLSDTVALIGGNNSGKSNFLKAITLPFLSDEKGNYGKNLSWIDINDAARNEYYNYVIQNQREILDGTVDEKTLISKLPTIIVEVELEPCIDIDAYYLKELSYDITSGNIKYGLVYKYYPSNHNQIYNLIKTVLNEGELTIDNYKNSKMNLLPTDYYSYSIEVPNKGSVSYDTLKNFKYLRLEAERDDFSKTNDRMGSKSLIKLLQNNLSDVNKLKIENEYNHFFEELKNIIGIDQVLNWQEETKLKNAEDFFQHISILPNMPSMHSILNSVRLGYSDEELSLQGLGYRNLILMLVLINSYNGKNDSAFSAITIEEPEAHLCINNERLMVSFIDTFTNQNHLVQLFYSTHSTEFINKMNLKNVIILSGGQAFSLANELSQADMDYLTKNPNLDLFKLFFSKKCILFEGITEEMLIRSYLASCKELSDIELISFHKGYEKIMEIWLKVNNNTNNKLGIIRDYDDQEKAKKNHDKFSDDKKICVRTTEKRTLEPEIVSTANNYQILKEKYGDKLKWNNLTKEELEIKWQEMKAKDMLEICKDIELGELKGFVMPRHIQEVLDFMK